jgi:Fic family protein
MKYNWQLPDWPNFSYKTEGLAKIISEYKKCAYGFQGKLEQISEESQAEAYINLIVEEAISTSAIEGENLNRAEVRSSVARFLGINLTPQKGYFPKEEGIAALLISVRESFKQPLSKEKLCYWHKQLLHGSEASPLYQENRHQITKGDYRDKHIEIIKEGPFGEQDVIFEGPGDTRQAVSTEMDKFIAWYNATSPLSDIGNEIAGPVRAAIAHLWFVAIHPFDDGNGRIARAIAEHALFQDFDNPPLFSLSMCINDYRGEYYKQLANTNASMEVSQWVSWFASMVKTAQNLSIEKVDFILKKAKFWHKHTATKINARQQKALDKIFGSGLNGFVKQGISNEKYRAITGCPPATATRDLKDLVDKGIFLLAGTGRRNLRYMINLVEDNPVFNIKGDTNDTVESNQSKRAQFLKGITDKLLNNIHRNVDFHQDVSNPKLLDLTAQYKELVGDDKEALSKLNEIIGGI